MPSNLKKMVRARMQATGEGWAKALLHVRSQAPGTADKIASTPATAQGTRAPNGTPLVYYPTYTLHDRLDAGTTEWLSKQQGDGPLAIEDVTDVCATFQVGATLRDRAGLVRGHVDPNGDYTLDGP